MIIFEKVDRIIQKVEAFLVGGFIKSNKELVFLVSLVVFPILTRVIPLPLVALFFVTCFLVYVSNHFYFYTNNKAAAENKKVNTTEYSWGFTREYNENLDFNNFTNYLKTKKWDFYRDYLLANKESVILFVFLFGDLLVAFKNLPLSTSGAYFAMSIFTKFVFIAYLYVVASTKAIENSNLSENEKQTAYLDAFYKNFSGLASSTFVIFFLFFSLGRFITEIFFGMKYLEFQTSLSFILLANCFLVIGLVVFSTGILVDKVRTWQVVKIFLPIFIALFIFINITHPDTVAFFILGAVAVQSIFIYNFAIRKPAYIDDTYNYLF